MKLEFVAVLHSFIYHLKNLSTFKMKEIKYFLHALLQLDLIIFSGQPQKRNIMAFVSITLNSNKFIQLDNLSIR